MIYNQLQELFDTLNTELFESILGNRIDNCIITLHRKNKSYSGMIYERFLNLDSSISKHHEIYLNPEYFGVRPHISLIQSLAHEMTHVYQHMYGTVEKEGSHNEEFMDFMMAIGLMPSSNGMPDGKSVGGKNFFNYPLVDGDFIRVCNDLAQQGKLIKWYDLSMPNNTNIDAIVKDLYAAKDLMGDFVDPLLLQVPILVSNNIDADKILDCVELDPVTNAINLDISRVTEIAVQAAAVSKVEEPKQSPTHYDEPKLSSTFVGDDLKSSSNAKSKKSEGQIESLADLGGNYEAIDESETSSGDCESNISDVSDDSHIQITDSFTPSTEPSIYGHDDEDDEAGRFLKQAMANKPEKPKKSEEDKPKSEKAAEIVTLLGLDGSSKKQPEKKKTKFKYTCPCENIIWGGLSMSIICGKCQLHYKCETQDVEANVVID